MKAIFISVLLALFSIGTTQAQQTGDFIITVATSDPLLNADSLDIYFHVPTTYNANEPSKLIMGFHGLGNPDNSAQIRDYLSPLGDSINAIVMAPDPYLQDQPPSEVVLNLAYDSVLTWFNIDTNQIYLTGYSAGSDVAAQYFFGEPSHLMKGLIWHSPGFFFTPDLSSPSEIPPVCLCSGTVDFTSFIQTNSLNNNLDDAGFPYLYNSIPGVGHTMEYSTFTEEMLECINFIDANQPNVGISEQNQTAISVYPNPISSESDLIINTVTGKTTITVRTITGQVLMQYKGIAQQDRLIISGITETLNSGLYVLSVNGKTHTKILVL